ncbi:DUF7822 domain-containing protein [Variovorax sp. RB2P76]|uniref:DUF7822 domain-containing protein n=1 Tax=Variovorax sp. RB2P76 TaxID=3443736 RepID=UPI003F449AD8
MANRSYLYSLSNRPSSYEDRPESICGLSEWAYDVPFMYRLLMSGEPQLCASLISDGLGDDAPDQKTKLFAISSNFDLGFERVKRFVDIVQHLPAPAPVAERPASSTLPPPPSLMDRLRQLFSSQPQAVPSKTAAAPATTSIQLSGWLDEAISFLEAHRNTHLLLETIELDCMSEDEEMALRACVESEVARCSHVGAAIDALPVGIAEAAILLRNATTQKYPAPLDAFFGLRLDDDCDSTRSGAAQYPLGLAWSEHLYFELFNRSEYEARASEAAEGKESSEAGSSST